MSIQAEQIPEEYAGYVVDILTQLDIRNHAAVSYTPLSRGWETIFQNIFFQRKATLLDSYRDNRLLSNLIHELGWEKPPEHQTHDEQGNPTFGTVNIFPNQLYRELLKKYAA